MLSPVANMDAAITAAAGCTAEIIKRLEHLTKWQAEQKKLLEERQTEQRFQLSLEKKQLYEKMGWSSASEQQNQLEKQHQHDEVAEARNSVNEGIVKQIVEEFEKLDQNSPEKQQRLNGRNSPALDMQIERKQLNLKKPNTKNEPTKRTFLKRGEGLRQRFKIDPNELRLNNLPPYRYANARKSLSARSSRQSVQIVPLESQQEIVVNSTTSLPGLDAQEKRFQQLLISANNNSTPELKHTNPNNREQTARAVTQMLPQVNYTDKTNKTDLPNADTISWSKILSAEMPQRYGLTQEQLFSQDDENLSVFELLEQQVADDIDEFAANANCIRKLIAEKIGNQMQIRMDESIEYTSDNADGAAEHSTTITADSTSTANYAVRKVRVHFADEVASIECEDDDDDVESQLLLGKNDNENGNNSDESILTLSPANEMLKQQRRKEMSMDADQSEYNDGIRRASLTAQNDESNDCFEKTKLLKLRLGELEKEMSTFKRNNLELIKAKQEHEHAKARHEQEHMQIIDKLNDEKVQVEIYLHDERMKLEEEKRKFEQQMRLQKNAASAKERKEVSKLKAELEELQSQLKQKEQSHVTAQGRLRAQVRNLEKDKKQLLEDIDELTRKNKKLEAENYKARADNGHKMLKEINRNIAKLAPKINGNAFLALANTGSAADMENECSQRAMPHAKEKKTSQSSLPRVNKKANLAVSVPSLQYCSPNDDNDDESVQDVLIDVPIAIDNASIYDEDDMQFMAELQQLKRTNNATETTTTTAETTATKEAAAATALPCSETTAAIAQNQSSSQKSELKREIINADGSKDIIYPNGNIKKISADSMNIRMLYFNKDIKETNVDEGTVKYYYAATNTWHTTYLDGLEILEFPNGQTEHRHKNGVIEVHFPNNIVKIIDPNDDKKLEEWRLADGTNVLNMRNGDKILMLPNGQKEIHTKLNKRREYPDGTVKLVFPDGSQETRYSNGRVRLKDKDGKLIMDVENVGETC